MLVRIGFRIFLAFQEKAVEGACVHLAFSLPHKLYDLGEVTDVPLVYFLICKTGTAILVPV